ncbi:alpha/beta fold hydrolase [Jatrophihabitans sp.]|uniref:alpha/beta fold hydrolase n=1 Tax=Jatrophihabitans sp. TaxID=1932789 RepID=UPI0030C758C7|nr:abhydrolase 18 [Jatrophihabitans sp.]
MGRIAEAGWRATGRLVSVAPVPELPEAKPLELPGRGFTVYVDTGLPAVADAAKRPTLVLLHALACTGLLTWYPSLEALSERYRVVVFDQRWHGRGIRSERFRLEDCADDAVAVADALGIDRFVPVGYSMGSLVSQLIWHRHPERVAGAVLAASTTHFRPGGGDAKAMRLLATRLYKTAERRIGAAPVEAPTVKQRNDNRWAVAQLRSTTPAEIAGAAAAITRFDSGPWIHTLRAPTSLVITAKDRAIPAARQRQLARLLPDSTSYEIAAGHASVVMSAAKFRPALLAACASVSVRLAASGREPR